MNEKTGTVGLDGPPGFCSVQYTFQVIAHAVDIFFSMARFITKQMKRQTVLDVRVAEIIMGMQAAGNLLLSGVGLCFSPAPEATCIPLVAPDKMDAVNTCI